MGRADNKAATREALVDAALAEFAEHGLDGPSLDAICARAGFTRGAFYVHFADREALLAAVMERVIGAWLAILVATAEPGQGFEATIDRFADAFAGLLRGEAEPALTASAQHFHLVLEACNRSPVVRERFTAMLGAGTAAIAAIAREGQAAGTVRPDLDAEASAPLLTALVLGLLAMVEAGVPIDPRTLAAAVRAVALVPSPGPPADLPSLTDERTRGR